MDKLNELIAKRGALVETLSTDALIDDDAKFRAAEAEIAELDKKIERARRAQDAAARDATPVGSSDANPMAEIEAVLEGEAQLGRRQEFARTANFDHYVRRARAELRHTAPTVYAQVTNPETSFRTLGEQLRAVCSYYISGRDVGTMDKRLVRAPTGASEVNDPTSAGFLVQADFAMAIFMRAYEMGELLNRVESKLSLSTNANGIKIPGIDETSRATGSRWGGVQSYWLAEGVSPAPTKPKFRLIELDLKKLISLMYVTDELIADAAVLTTIANQAFSEEVMFMTEDAIFRGSGAGQPQGFMKSDSKIAVEKEKGQAAKSIVYENVTNMWSRLWARSRRNAIWTINQDAEPQLLGLSQVIGTAGVPVYLPPNGLSGAPYGVLLGRPVIPLEYNETVGTEGDLALVDVSQYVLADKGGVQQATSMHVAFTTDEMVFRITYRVDGEPLWHKPLTPYKGSNTLSPFITLATRG